MSVRASFEEHFGVAQAERVMVAAEAHKNGLHDRPGGDPFRWALTICLGLQCLSKPSYRQHHGITVPWEDLKAWIKAHGDLYHHDGDVDYLALMAGVYEEYMPTQEEIAS